MLVFYFYLFFMKFTTTYQDELGWTTRRCLGPSSWQADTQSHDCCPVAADGDCRYMWGSKQCDCDSHIAPQISRHVLNSRMKLWVMAARALLFATLAASGLAAMVRNQFLLPSSCFLNRYHMTVTIPGEFVTFNSNQDFRLRLESLLFFARVFAWRVNK